MLGQVMPDISAIGLDDAGVVVFVLQIHDGAPEGIRCLTLA